MSIDLSLQVEDHQALALAQFVKRMTWTEMRACALDELEAYVILGALDNIAQALPNKAMRPADPASAFSGRFFPLECN
nr:hypothetical protein [uncultured Cupriavidus sp.]